VSPPLRIGGAGKVKMREVTRGRGPETSTRVKYTSSRPEPMWVIQAEIPSSIQAMPIGAW
jgi:hypothetical protein